MSKAAGSIPRPPPSTTVYELRFATREAEKGWVELVATARNAAIRAWDFLAQSPQQVDPERCYPLKGDLAKVTINGVNLTRWQYKPTSGGRIWYAVQPSPKGEMRGGVVWLERVMTRHPNETIKQHR